MSHWNVTYPKDQYSSGTYEVQVEIYRWTLFYWNIGSKRLYFDLTREYPHELFFETEKLSQAHLHVAFFKLELVSFLH